eukprot:CAMPEP_0203754616 /NCGR_PEP_ID=MMETSP0098-20131031/8200_1 /ASSEMBLY_ACC=CAM_ASM_000208 /TAXON_ID=96639 /ORGANISM=" , Strain NY0313808BC1" /LENGTH=276 /DNA_ID=CAMNT_0050645721 /DNA_START=2005 /DNA_END=2835 /DNA_ORIENTATION=+
MKLTWVNFNPLMDEKIKPAHSSNAFSELHAKETSKVHKGFNEAYRSIRSELAQVVKPLLYNADSGKQKRALFCTGHSLGGALAVLFSTDFSFSAISEKNTRLHVACTTWGCPRIGNYAFSKRAESLVPSLKRFVLAGDIIPKTPPRWHRFPYKGYYHVGVEMLLDLHGNCLRNPNLAERVFAHGLNPKNKETHFNSRYCIALMLWAARMNLDVVFFGPVVANMTKNCMHIINSRDKALILASTRVLYLNGELDLKKFSRPTMTSSCQCNHGAYDKA